MMNSFFIKKTLPVLSGLLLLASLFLIFKTNKNKAETIFKKELIQNYEATNHITNQATSNDYKKMQKITSYRPNDRPLAESINQVIQISKQVKAILQNIFKNNSTEQNSKINQTIHDYQTSINTLLDSIKRILPIVTSEEITAIKSILNFDTIPPLSEVNSFRKSILLNNTNANSLHLVSYFSHKIGGPNMTSYRFQPVVSLGSITPNTDLFKIYLSHPSAFSIKNLEMYANKKKIPLVDFDRKIQIPIKNNSTQRLILSANWENPNYPNLEIPLISSISDTFTITLFN